MKFTVNTLDADKQQSDCLVIGLFEDSGLSLSAKQLNIASGRAIETAQSHGDFSPKLDHTLLLSNLPNNLPRVLLVGCGETKKFNEKQFTKTIKSAFIALKQTAYQSIGFYLTELPVSCRTLEWMVRTAIITVSQMDYCFDTYKSNKPDAFSIESINFYAQSAQDMAAAEIAIQEGLAIASGMHATKQLADTPCNVCTPSYIANAAQKLAKQHSSLKAKVYDEKTLEKMGFGAFVSVSKGSSEPGQFVLLEYKGGEKNDAPIALVGKGVTFDTGGLSLKPPASMLEMKFDMCGAATVFGVVKAIAELALPINLVAALACVENMPGGNATKPESVVTTLSGQTVEITNTDAEGRLVLCDALTYVEREYKPKAMIDVATLTGAVIVALGRSMAGLFSNNTELADALKQAAQQANDPVWQLPLDESYDQLLESTTADMMNLALVREASSSVAACYLARFVKDTPWAHLDIAGVANLSGSKKSATGRSVPLLIQYLLNQAQSQD